jgi:trehalose/maltose transport system substrate-binding protein
VSFEGWDRCFAREQRYPPEAAADLVRYLASEEQQKKRAIGLGLLPTLPALYSDPDVLAKNAWPKNVDVLTNLVAHPSTVTGAEFDGILIALVCEVSQAKKGEGPVI